MTAAEVPTKVDVSALTSEGSPRLRDGSLVRSMSMRMDYLRTANRIIGDINSFAEKIAEHDPEFDAHTGTDIALMLLAHRLNAILVRALELDDPVLKAILESLGLYAAASDEARPVRVSDEDRLMPGFGRPSDPSPATDVLDRIADSVERGVHHDEDWTLEATLASLRSEAVMKTIADQIRKGTLSSGEGSVPAWRMHVAARGA